MSNTNTSLHLAVQNGNIDIVKMLLEAGHNPNEVNADSLTALDLAVMVNNTEVVQLLLEHKGKTTAPPITQKPSAQSLAPNMALKKKYFEEPETLPGRQINYDVGEGFAMGLHITITFILIYIGFFLFVGGLISGILFGGISENALLNFVSAVAVILLGTCFLVFGLRQLKHWDRWWFSFWIRIWLIFIILSFTLNIVGVLYNLFFVTV